MPQIGMQLPYFTLAWAASAENAFSVQWLDEDSEPLDLTDTTVQIRMHDDTLFVATNTAGAYSNWTIDAGDADPAFIGQSFRLEFEVDAVPFLIGNGKVIAA